MINSRWSTNLMLTAIALLLGGLSNSAPAPSTAERGVAKPPNIVVVMADDLSSDLVKYMDAVQALAAEAVTFDHYFVSNSLCCPSRGTFFTGKYPHNSKVEGNLWPDGGFMRFVRHDLRTSLGPYMSSA